MTSDVPKHVRAMLSPERNWIPRIVLRSSFENGEPDPTGTATTLKITDTMHGQSISKESLSTLRSTKNSLESRFERAFVWMDG